MALLFMDSFDHYDTANLLKKWTGSTGSATISSANGRRGSAALRVVHSGASSTVYAEKTLTPGDPTCIVGFAINPSALTVPGATGAPLVSVRDGSLCQVALRLNSNGTLSVTRSHQGGTVLGTTTAVIAAAAFSYIEFKVLVHPSAGTIDVAINGNPALTLTAQNTRNTSNSQWTSIALGAVDSNGGTFNTAGNLDFDDLYVLDGTGASPWNAFLGDVRVDPRNPTAAGASSGWIPSAGANWQCVDETPPNDDTDYNAANVSGLTDTFVTQDAPVAGAAIYGVQHCLDVRKTDAGTCSIAPVIRHAGVDFVGANANPGTTYGFTLSIAQINPGTSDQWTESGFNAAEFGYKRTV